MVQVLPAVPGFGEKLIETLSQAGSSVARGLQQRNAVTALQQALNPMTNADMPSSQGMLSSPMSSFPQSQPQSEVNPAKVMQLYQLAERAVGPEGAKQLAGAYLEKQKQATKEQAEISKEGRARSEKYLDKVSGERTVLPDLETSLVRIEDALASKDLKSIQNWIADRTGDDYLRTSSSAALNSAVKEFLLADLGRIKGGRPNQFLEQQLSTSYPKAGYDPKANDKIFLAMQSGVDLRRKEIEISDGIKERFDNAGRPLPSNFENLVYKELRPYVESKEKELIGEYKQINSGKGRFDKEFKGRSPEGSTPVISPSGERGYIPLDQLENALKQGYKAA